MPITRTTNAHPHPAHRLALVAAVAAFVCGSSPSSRTRSFFAGGSSPHSCGFGGMAAANTVLPAANSANQACSRRQSPRTRAVYACSRRQ
ncbi:MAG: hypothetical protein J0L63_02960 [Anaerolineae bacterium]|nr:hypothetical protein [Anaerolineae bacterium]